MVLSNLVLSKTGSQGCKLLINALVISHLDYCKSILYGLPKYDKIQRVRNTASQRLTGALHQDHSTTVLRNLNWFSIESRTVCLVLLLTFTAPHKLFPTYKSNLL